MTRFVLILRVEVQASLTQNLTSPCHCVTRLGMICVQHTDEVRLLFRYPGVHPTSLAKRRARRRTGKIFTLDVYTILRVVFDGCTFSQHPTGDDASERTG